MSFLEKETKEKLEEVTNGLQKGFHESAEELKKNKSLFKNPFVVTVLLVVGAAVVLNPGYLLLGLALCFLVLLVVNVPIKTILGALFGVPRDAIKNRKKVALELKNSISKKQEEPIENKPEDKTKGQG